MKKLLLPSFFLLLIVVSCQSTQGVVNYDRSKSADAVLLLGQDLIRLSREIRLTKTDIEDLVPPSYRAYIDYVPRYETLLDSYLENVTECVPSYMDEVYDLVSTETATLSRMADQYIIDDTSLTDKMIVDLSEHLKLHLGDLFLENPEPLKKAFEESRFELGGIKEVYENLAQIKVDITLPEAGEINYDRLASRVIDLMFENFAELEKSIKNQQSNRHSDGPYSIFWEARLE